MKKLLVVLFVLALVCAAPAAAKKTKCATIQDGTILYSAGHYLAGQSITTGFDPWGYNYQAHMFSGSYFNSYAGGAAFPPYEGDDQAYLLANPSAANHWAWPYRNVDMTMKWNDAWISNTDCGMDGLAGNVPDGKLDRYFGFATYRGSGAWLTNHQSGTYEEDGKTCHWTYFVKIVAAPADATLYGGDWIAADGTEIGPSIWGSFAVIQEVENDTCAGTNGKQYGSPGGPGFGQFKP